MILYRAFQAIIWAICLGFVIFSCVTSYGGKKNRRYKIKKTEIK
jgi:hypothetical protein